MRVHKVRDPSLYMWPVQLEVLDEDLAPKVMAPDEYAPGADIGRLFDEGKTMDEVGARKGGAKVGEGGPHAAACAARAFNARWGLELSARRPAPACDARRYRTLSGGHASSARATCWSRTSPW